VTRASRRRGIVIPAILTLVGLIVLVGLGTWQLERKAWKEDLIARLEARLQAAPTELPPRAEWEQEEFRRVSFPAEFLHAEEALVYTAGSSLRPDVSGPGYWIFTPARLSGGSLVVVNRGFAPAGREDPKTRSEGQVPGVVDIVGFMRWPEERGTFTPNDDPAKNLWYVRDPEAMAAAKRWGKVAPFYIDQEGPVPSGGLPRPGAIRASLPNNHLQYAITWYGLAVALAVIFAIWMRGRTRRIP
jgi:surfeit locus 1 family protein